VNEHTMEMEFKKKQWERQQKIINRERQKVQESLDLIKAYEVDIRGTELISILDNKETSIIEAFDAFCHYKMIRYTRKFQNF